MWSAFGFSYNVFLCILTYVLPLSAMSVIYTVIGVELWMSGPIGNTTQGQDCNQKAKRRVSQSEGNWCTRVH